MIEIYNVRYYMELGCGSDAWRIVCQAENHPVFGNSEVRPSTPISYDKELKTFQSASGNVYHINSFQMNESDFWEQMEKDSNKGYELH